MHGYYYFFKCSSVAIYSHKFSLLAVQLFHCHFQTYAVMEIVYVYTKKRSEFGRQSLFSNTSAQLHINIEPDESLRDNFIEKDPVDMAVQYAPEMTEHEVTIS